MSMGGSSGTQTVNNQTILPDWVNAQAAQNIVAANQLGQQPYTPPPGPLVAGFTPAQTQAFADVNKLQGFTTPWYNRAISSTRNLPAETQSLLQPYVANVGGATTGAINQTAAGMAGALNANAPAANAFGGNETATALRQLGSETQRNIGQALDTIQAQGWNVASQEALNRATAMGNLASGAQSANLTGVNALLQTGAQQQALTQAQYATQLAQWQQAQNWPYQQLAVQQGALAGTPYGATVQAQQPYNINPAASYAGLATASVPLLQSTYKWAFGGVPTTTAPYPGAGGSLSGAMGLGTAAQPA